MFQAQYIFLHQSTLELLNNKGNSQSIWFVSYSALEKMDSLDAMEGNGIMDTRLNVGQPRVHTTSHILLSRGRWAGMGGNHYVKYDWRRSSTLRLECRLWTGSPPACRSGGGRQEVMSALWRERSNSQLGFCCSGSISPLIIFLSFKEPLVHFSKSWKTRGRQRIQTQCREKQKCKQWADRKTSVASVSLQVIIPSLRCNCCTMLTSTMFFKDNLFSQIHNFSASL